MHKTTLALSKLKSAQPARKQIHLGFEIENEKVLNKKPEIKKKLKEDTTSTTNSIEERRNKRRKFELLKSLRVKPDVRDRTREQTLKKVATKGVVQLFNAVQNQQRSLKQQVQAEKIDSKREDILNNINKKNFLNVLMGGAKSMLIDNPVKKEKCDDDDEEERPAKRVTKESTWNVLKDNFVNSTAKGSVAWDEDDEDEEEQAVDND